MKAHVTLFSSKEANHGTPSQGSWPDLIKKTLGTRDESSIHELFSPVRFTDDKRANENVIQVYALVLDFDGKKFDPEWIDKENKRRVEKNPDIPLLVVKAGNATTVEEALKRWNYKGWWHHTRSHNEKYPSFRILIPHGEPVSASDHDKIYQASLDRENDLASATSLDNSTKDPARIWYMPEGDHSWQKIDGSQFNEDEWREWVRESEPATRNLFDPNVELPELSENETRIAAYLGGMPPSIQGQNGSTACFNAARKVFDLGVDSESRVVELLELYYNPSCVPPWSLKELQHKANDALNSRIKNPVATPINVPLPRVGPKGHQPESADKLFGPLITTDKGRVLPRLHNYVYLIHAAFGAMVRFDEFLQKVRATGPLPWAPIGYPRDWQDVDSLQMCAWLERTHGVAAAENKTYNAITVVAEANKFDSYKDHMNALPSWDGVERLTTWLTNYLGVFETIYSRTVGRAFLIAMVARAMDPGCHVHNVIVLEGSQGIGKSRAARTLAGNEQWFTSAIPDLQSKDAAIIIQGKAVAELAELAAMKRSNNESSKEFITRNYDKYRPPYGRNEVTSPRRCVFIATTNHTNYLTDETGGRRYWPVKCADKINLDLLSRERNQLLAEAKKAYDSGEKWYGRDIDSRAAGEQSKRTEGDPWDDDVDRYIASDTRRYTSPGKYEDFVGTTEIMSILGISTDKRNAGTSQRVSRIMRARGWLPLRIEIRVKKTRTPVRGFALAKSENVVELNAVQPPEQGMVGAEQAGEQLGLDEAEEVEGYSETGIDESMKDVTFNPGA